MSSSATRHSRFSDIESLFDEGFPVDAMSPGDVMSHGIICYFDNSSLFCYSCNPLLARRPPVPIGNRLQMMTYLNTSYCICHFLALLNVSTHSTPWCHVVAYSGMYACKCFRRRRNRLHSFWIVHCAQAYGFTAATSGRATGLHSGTAENRTGIQPPLLFVLTRVMSVTFRCLLPAWRGRSSWDGLPY